MDSKMNYSLGLKKKQKEEEQYKINKKVDFIMDQLPLELQIEVLSYIPINMTFKVSALECYKNHFLNDVCDRFRYCMREIRTDTQNFVSVPIISNTQEDVLQFLPKKFRKFRKFMNNLIEQNPIDPNLELKDYTVNVKFTEKQFHNYCKLMLRLLVDLNFGKNNILRFASEQLKNDTKFMLAAVRTDSCPLDYASDELKNDREFMLAAVQQNGAALYYTSDELKNDKEVVMKAVQQNGWSSLKFASLQLKNSREMRLAARKQQQQEQQQIYQKWKQTNQANNN